MAVTNEEHRWEDVGDGYSTSFPIGANFDYDADIKVYVDGAFQAEGYQISGAGGTNGGAVVFDVAPVDGAVVVSLLDPALVQKRDLPNAGGGAAALNLIERAMDRLTRITQVMTSRIMRGLQLPDGGIDGESFFDARGNRIGNVADPENDSDAVPKSYIGKQVVAVNEAAQTAVDNAVQTGNDAKATAADRLQTGLDREAAAASAELAQQAQPIAITDEGRTLVAKETVAEMRTLLEVPSSDDLATKANASTAVTLTGTQTVSNKTLTSPVINAPTGSFISGYLYGLKTSNAVVDAANDITVDAGVCASDDATPAFIALASAITKQADATWVAGDGNGGYDSGTAPADGTLHVFAIMRSDTHQADILFSASATSPIMPANYDHKRRIASIPRISAVNLGFVQVGDLFMLSEVSAAGNYINPGTIASLRTLPAVPTGISVEARLAVVLDAASSSPTSLMLTSPEQSDVVPSVGVYSFRAAPSGRVSGNLGLLTDTSARVRARLSHSDSSSSYGFSGHGWRDTRGRI